MAEDEIERLLREIDAANATPTSPAAAPARKPTAQPVPADGGQGGGRLAFAAIAGVTLGGATFVLSLLTPFTDNFWTAAGAAGGAFVTAVVAGPPRWFSR